MANEKRLIDADALLERMSFVTTDDTCPLHIAAMIDQEIELAPTVDAVEVVHGKWEIRPHLYRAFYPEYCCSACGGWKHKLAYEHEGMNYCPNCGAKMDGDGNG